ncbi:hypothetical protein Neosp_012288 [[Neocosmospora] mangrovei]
MDVAGLVVGIISLYSAGQSCYALYTDVRDAKDNFRAALHDLQIHRSIHKAWAANWGIREDAAVEPGETEAPDRDGRKLKLYLTKYPDKARGIASALIRTSDVLSNGKKLSDDYGLETNLEINLPANDTLTEGGRLPDDRNWAKFREDVTEKAKVFSSRIRFNQRFKWALKDQKKFNALIAELKKYNDALHLLSPDFAFEILQMSLALELLQNWDEADLRLLRQRQRQQRQHLEQQDTQDEQREPDADASSSNTAFPEQQSTSPSDEGTQVLADLAEITLAVAAAARTRHDVLSDEVEKRLLSIRKDILDFGKHSGTRGMAVMRKPERNKAVAVVVDTYSYKTEDGETLQKKIRASILRLGQVLMLPSCSKHLGTLELIGMAEDTEEKTIMLVYKLPATLGLHRPGFPVHDLAIRKPRNVLASRPGDRGHDLGYRFDLARKLVQSVAFLHACGWLHKNIRTDNLVYFPKDGPTLSRDYDKMDLNTVFLRGFDYSRQDDVQEEDSGDGDGVQPQTHDVVHQTGNSPHQTAIASSSGGGARDATSSVHAEDNLSRGPDSGGGDIEDEDDYASNSSLPYIPSNFSITGEPSRINLDGRHHPYKRVYPDRVYRHAFDVYSLGIALFEIGMGKEIEDLMPESFEEKEPYKARRDVIQEAERLLPAACGQAYTNAVLSCLNLDQEDVTGGPVTQREICATVAVQLAQCRA